MRKVLIVTAGFGYGGVRAFVMNYYKKLDLSKFHVDIYVLNASNSPFEKEVQELGGSVYFDSEQFSSKRIPHFIKKWVRFLKKNDYDVVHANCNLTNTWILLAGKLAGVQTLISHTHTSEYAVKGTMLWSFFVSLRRFLLNKISTVNFACGDYAGLTTYGKKTKFYVLNNCIDYPLFSMPSHETIGELKTQLLNENATKHPVYGNISLFSYNKNQLFILEIFREIKKVQPNALLLLGGPTSDVSAKVVLDTLQRNIKDYGLNDSVKIFGAVSNMSDFYGIIDCWIFPSLHEGLPISLLELQAASVPIVSSDQVTQSCDLGLSLVKFVSLSESPKTWADIAISQNKQKLSDEMIKEAFVKNGFDFNNNISLLENCYSGSKNKDH